MQTTRYSTWLADAAEKVTTRRKALNLSQSQLAKEAELSQQTVSRIEQAKFEPKTTTKVRLAEALLCDVADLFDHEGLT